MTELFVFYEEAFSDHLKQLYLYCLKFEGYNLVHQNAQQRIASVMLAVIDRYEDLTQEQELRLLQEMEAFFLFIRNWTQENDLNEKERTMVAKFLVFLFDEHITKKGYYSWNFKKNIV